MTNKTWIQTLHLKSKEPTTLPRKTCVLIAVRKYIWCHTTNWYGGTFHDPVIIYTTTEEWHGGTVHTKLGPFMLHTSYDPISPYGMYQVCLSFVFIVPFSRQKYDHICIYFKCILINLIGFWRKILDGETWNIDLFLGSERWL